MPPKPSQATLPPSFIAKKAKILSILSVPDSEYDDLSPKGSVDVNIRKLIDEINGEDGWVTTSSCAGRVSVYLDGERSVKKSDVTSQDSQVETQEVADSGNENGERGETKTGGKGGGRWLYVSHDPVCLTAGESYTSLFGLQPYGATSENVLASSLNKDSRLIHFKFEPMILHVLAGSPFHSQAILTAALQAGFRESGALNILPSSTSHEGATPMVGIRSMGLGLESIIGFESNGEMKSLVPEWQLAALVDISGQRFVENSKRIQRFEDLLKEGLTNEDGEGRRKGQEGTEWEDKDTRRKRKAEEGRKRAEELKKAKEEAKGSSTVDEADGPDIAGLNI